MMKSITLACIVLLLVGCSSPGVLTVRQGTDTSPRISSVPQDGTYALFIAGESQPLFDFPLKKNQPIGFERSQDGMITWLNAVAGKNHFRLDVTKTYEWRQLPGSDDH